MKVFITGASGFVGSAIVDELIRNKHTVTALVRSEESLQKIRKAGIEPVFGSLEDFDTLKKSAESADAVIHAAFNNDFSEFGKTVIIDQNAINELGSALKNTQKTFVVTGGLLGVKSASGNLIDENDAVPAAPRASEATALAWAQKGVRACVIRLAPSVHDENDHGFIPALIRLAKEKGFSAYVGDGQNRWPAVHRLDAAVLYRLAIEDGIGGSRYNAIDDEGVSFQQIAKAIGTNLNIPVISIAPDAVKAHFKWLSPFVIMDSPGSSQKTKASLEWHPNQVGLLEDMNDNYFKK